MLPRLCRPCALGALGGVAALSRMATAQQLPNVPTPVGANDDDFLSVFDGLAQNGLSVIAFLIGAAAFIVVGWAVVAKFNECRQGRAEWSEAGVTAGAGAIILVFTTFLLGQANAIFA